MYNMSGLKEVPTTSDVKYTGPSNNTLSRPPWNPVTANLASLSEHDMALTRSPYFVENTIILIILGTTFETTYIQQGTTKFHSIPY